MASGNGISGLLETGVTGAPSYGHEINRKMSLSIFSYSSSHSSVCLFLFSKPAPEVKPGRG